MPVGQRGSGSGEEEQHGRPERGDRDDAEVEDEEEEEQAATSREHGDEYSGDGDSDADADFNPLFQRSPSAELSEQGLGEGEEAREKENDEVAETELEDGVDEDEAGLDQEEDEQEADEESGGSASSSSDDEEGEEEQTEEALQQPADGSRARQRVQITSSSICQAQQEAAGDVRQTSAGEGAGEGREEARHDGQVQQDAGDQMQDEFRQNPSLCRVSRIQVVETAGELDTASVEAEGCPPPPAAGLPGGPEEVQDAISRRTRAHLSLVDMSLDDLEAFLQHSDEEEFFQHVDDEEEYRKFLAAVQGPDLDAAGPADEADDDDDDDDDDQDFEIGEALEREMLEQLGQLEQEIVDTKAPRRRTSRRRGGRRHAAVPATGRLRPLLPNVPLARDHGVPASGVVQQCFTARQVWQLYCQVHEHVQLLIQVFAMTILEAAQQDVAVAAHKLLIELGAARAVVLSWKKSAFPASCFQPPEVPVEHKDDRGNGAAATVVAGGPSIIDVQWPWTPSVAGPVRSLLDVAPLAMLESFFKTIGHGKLPFFLLPMEGSPPTFAAVQGQKEREQQFPHSNVFVSEVARLPLFKLPGGEGCSSGASVEQSPGRSTRQPPGSQQPWWVRPWDQFGVALVRESVAGAVACFQELFNVGLYPRHQTSSLGGNGHLLFTEAEDRLLALGMEVYNSDWSAIQRRFLPPKTVNQIFNRQKNCCSSRAPDNVIKAVRQRKNAPLTDQEVELVEAVSRALPVKAVCGGPSCCLSVSLFIYLHKFKTNYVGCRAVIQALREKTTDWNAICQLKLPHRDPATLPRLYRAAKGILPRTYKDPVRSERRRLSRRARVIGEAREMLQPDLDEEFDNVLEDQGDAYIRDAFLADVPAAGTGARAWADAGHSPGKEAGAPAPPSSTELDTAGEQELQAARRGQQEENKGISVGQVSASASTEGVTAAAAAVSLPSDSSQGGSSASLAPRPAVALPQHDAVSLQEALIPSTTWHIPPTTANPRPIRVPGRRKSRLTRAAPALLPPLVMPDGRIIQLRAVPGAPPPAPSAAPAVQRAPWHPCTAATEAAEAFTGQEDSREKPKRPKARTAKVRRGADVQADAGASEAPSVSAWAYLGSPPLAVAVAGRRPGAVLGGANIGQRQAQAAEGGGSSAPEMHVQEAVSTVRDVAGEGRPGTEWSARPEVREKPGTTAAGTQPEDAGQAATRQAPAAARPEPASAVRWPSLPIVMEEEELSDSDEEPAAGPEQAPGSLRALPGMGVASVQDGASGGGFSAQQQQVPSAPASGGRLGSSGTEFGEGGVEFECEEMSDSDSAGDRGAAEEVRHRSQRLAGHAPAWVEAAAREG
eukprot:SM000391S15188  [mRNA]  locus=s391:2:5150:- [translate_table: standard]